MAATRLLSIAKIMENVECLLANMGVRRGGQEGALALPWKTKKVEKIRMKKCKLRNYTKSWKIQMSLLQNE